MVVDGELESAEMACPVHGSAGMRLADEGHGQHVPVERRGHVGSLRGQYDGFESTDQRLGHRPSFLNTVIPARNGVGTDYSWPGWWSAGLGAHGEQELVQHDAALGHLAGAAEVQRADQTTRVRSE